MLQKKNTLKIMRKIILGLTAALFVLTAASCSKDNTIRYNNASMGNVVNGQLVSDQGNILNVVEQSCQGKIDTMQRVFMVCDILSKTAESEYDVRMHYLTEVLTKTPLAMSEVTDEKLLKDDPLLLTDLWISGGYINIYMTVPIIESSKKKHHINLVYDNTVQKDGEHTFHIHHNADGEVLSDDIVNNSNMKLAGAYVSFRIADLIKENSAKLKIRWCSYKAENGYIISDTLDAEAERNYSKDVFEHVPSTETSAMLLSIE